MDARTRAFKAGIINPLVLSSVIVETIDLMREAGRTILMPGRHDVVAELKTDLGLTDPVTEIDRSISDFLLTALRDRLPGSYSEEDMPASAAERRRESLLWQVDPLDGTQEFIEGYIEGVAIQGALLARLGDTYAPIAGIIYSPASDSLWYTDENGKAKWERKGKPHQLPALTRDKTLTGTLRKVEPDASLEAFYAALAARHGEEVRLLQSGGAGRWFSDLLEGNADIIMANQDRSKAWDVAMGIALVEARGGFVCDYHGREISDLNSEELRNKEGFVASILYQKEEILPHIPHDLLKRF